MARKFLSDAGMDPKTRAAGLLVLLYGIQLTRIVTITRTQIDTSSRPVTLTVGAEPIGLPEILGDAISDLADANNELPRELRGTLASLGLWVIQECDRLISGTGGDIPMLIDVNRAIRDGLK